MRSLSSLKTVLSIQPRWTLNHPSVILLFFPSNRWKCSVDAAGQVKDTKSVSAGLDYPGVGPEHSWLKDIGRAEYVAVSDDEALKAFHEVTELEGIMPALETAHAFAYLEPLMKELDSSSNVVVNVSGRGDKDINTVAQIDGIEF